MSQDTVKAVQYDRYGPPEVLQVRAVPKPAPKAGQVLVRVVAAGVNPVEAQVRAGKMRLITGRRFPKGIGADFSGTVVEVGPGVDPALAGSDVWGAVDPLRGAVTAEYIAVRAKAVAPAPAGLDLAEAAALPTVGITALMALEALAPKAGDRLLIIGAAGGVGSALVQMAAARKARVATVSSERNLDLCRELGAAETYAYDRPQDFVDERFDAIADLHGGQVMALRKRLGRGGRMITIAAGAAPAAFGSVLLPGPTITFVRVQPNVSRLTELARLVERGDLRPVIDSFYALDDAAEAHRLIETGHSRGKRVLLVASR